MLPDCVNSISHQTFEGEFHIGPVQVVGTLLSDGDKGHEGSCEERS